MGLVLCLVCVEKALVVPQPTTPDSESSIVSIGRQTQVREQLNEDKHGQCQNHPMACIVGMWRTNNQTDLQAPSI